MNFNMRVFDVLIIAEMKGLKNLCQLGNVEPYRIDTKSSHLMMPQTSAANARTTKTLDGEIGNNTA